MLPAMQAILDEYQKSINELVTVIRPLRNEQLIQVVDLETEDEDCKSIQTILSHVVSAGYNYTVAIQKHLGLNVEYYQKTQCNSSEEYIFHLNKMFAYCRLFFENNTINSIDEKDNSKKILVRWGQSYDIEQLMEHAIVHVLRHRRQIENFIQKLS